VVLVLVTTLYFFLSSPSTCIWKPFLAGLLVYSLHVFPVYGVVTLLSFCKHSNSLEINTSTGLDCDYDTSFVLVSRLEDEVGLHLTVLCWYITISN
jgi:hypothetical protein